MSDKGRTQRRRLGKSGPEVLPIGLGLMSLSGTYGPSDDKAAEALIRQAIELGEPGLVRVNEGWGKISFAPKAA